MGLLWIFFYYGDLFGPLWSCNSVWMQKILWTHIFNYTIRHSKKLTDRCIHMQTHKLTHNDYISTGLCSFVCSFSQDTRREKFSDLFLLIRGLLLCSQLYLSGLPFVVKCLHVEGFRPEWYISTIYQCKDIPFWSETFHFRMWLVFNPTIEVVTFCLHGWCMLGVFCCLHSLL